MNSRLKELRLAINLNQEKFGERIGLTRSAICNYENGTRALTEQTIKSICREFGVNYLWLTTGTGEMFTNLPETIVDELAEEFDLDESEKELVLEFVKLPKDQRQTLMKFLRRT